MEISYTDAICPYTESFLFECIPDLEDQIFRESSATGDGNVITDPIEVNTKDRLPEIPDGRKLVLVRTPWGMFCWDGEFWTVPGNNYRSWKIVPPPPVWYDEDLEDSSLELWLRDDDVVL